MKNAEWFKVALTHVFYTTYALGYFDKEFGYSITLTD